ncbi:MAG: hypothetical protein A2571_03315 [Candidatus Vogelbacteria bacterium RIFOXYD1_FULL_44_32]|uniref:Coenzyme F420:L-glutamate ligase-like domain-containing protein n=1 Tax=Candidatus Vogelbacteria bacterium RIFOXYD1_FULL_44_32 TaxID=1802438 RepID=A0A1G2QDW8_9BACT|nr:MAG: hypothetical protein A2571_03315 [Candidatus Vogelbacteria bacterium RIFOXYD1_FULL_44_32]
MKIIGVKTPLLKAGDDLIQFIIKNIPSLSEGSVVVVTSKIVALAEGRLAPLSAKEAIIKRESKEVIETPYGFLTLTKDGWCVNAGVDESNAKDGLILLPLDAFQSAEVLCRSLRQKFKIKKLGVLITDTKSVPLRVGTVGRALGFAGFQPLRSYINKRDLFGRKSRFTESNLADSLAAAAVLLMGEGSERVPLAVIQEAPVTFVGVGTSQTTKLSLPPQLDIFRYVFSRASSPRAKKKPKR